MINLALWGDKIETAVDRACNSVSQRITVPDLRVVQTFDWLEFFQNR